MDTDGQRTDLGTWALRLVAAVILAFLLAPVAIIVATSFSGTSLLSFPPKTWGLRWYAKFLSDAGWQRAVVTSLQVAPLAAALATSAGFLASLALVRGRLLRGRTAIYGVLLTPMIVPSIISAIAFYLSFAKLGAAGSIVAMALGHAVLALPLVVIVLSSSLQSLDERYEWAALSMGAGNWMTMWRVTIPLAAPSLISAALFAFLFSFDDLLVSLFLASATTQTITVRIWNSLQLDVDPTISAVSSVLIAVTVLVLISNALLQKPKASS